MKTSEFLEALKADTAAISGTVKNDFYTLPDNLLNYKADASRWSILECFAHLNLYNRYYLKAIEDAFFASGGLAEEEIRTTWIGRKSVNMMMPGNKKKQKTFKKMDPVYSMKDRTVLDHFLNDQEKLIMLLQKATQVNVNARKVPVEFFRLLKMNIGEALQFVVVHEQRHVLQAHTILTAAPVSKTPVLFI
jgi:uncharacterized damage-inducible protein DinB